MPLRVMSCIVGNSGGRPGADSWMRRRDAWVGCVRRFDPDLIGVQSVYEDQCQFMRRSLDDYAMHVTRRPSRDRTKRYANQEFIVLLVRRDRFDCLAGAKFWLSPYAHIYTYPTIGWDAAQPQLCVWQRLYDGTTGRELVFATTKLDHRGAISRLESTAMIRKELSAAAADDPVILTGNFSGTEGDPPHSALTEQSGWIDAYRSVHPARRDDELTFHAYLGSAVGRRMDWILHTSNLTSTRAAIDRTALESGRFPTNHYPVTAELEWPDTPGGARG